MPIEWPADLPLWHDGEFSEEANTNWANDAAEVGAARRRKRFTRSLRRFRIVLVLNAAQREILDEFFHSTTDGGVLTFDWTHPLDETTYGVRFASPPTFSHLTAELWKAEVQFEEV